MAIERKWKIHREKRSYYMKKAIEPTTQILISSVEWVFFCINFAYFSLSFVLFRFMFSLENLLFLFFPIASFIFSYFVLLFSRFLPLQLNSLTHYTAHTRNMWNDGENKACERSEFEGNFSKFWLDSSSFRSLFNDSLAFRLKLFSQLDSGCL